MSLLFFFMAIWPCLNAQTSDDVKFILSNRIIVDVLLNGTTEDYTKFVEDVACKFVTHGWINDSDDPPVQLIKNNFLNCSNVNVIAVDWRKDSQNIIYLGPAWDTQEVGKIVGEKMLELVGAGVCRFNNTHCIGHSLGSHVCGDAASYVQKQSGKNISRVSALDPAGPLFEHNFGIIPSVNEKDACFVDAIHTSTDFGYDQPVGDADFFPNGGQQPQPGCINLDILCSHMRAFELFAESICDRNAFRSTQCGSYFLYRSGRCKGNPTALMGEYCPRNAFGEYFLETNSEYPYTKS